MQSINYRWENYILRSTLYKEFVNSVTIIYFIQWFETIQI